MKCERCGKEFEGTSRFCSRSCANSRPQTAEVRLKKSLALKGRGDGPSLDARQKAKDTWKKKRVDWICPQCGKHLLLAPADASKRKYCSGTCRNLATNASKNGAVSKAERILCSILEKSGYQVDTNRRDILQGLEIDIYIPALNVGIEYNGIYHLQPIHGQEMLDRIQKKDAIKKELADQLGLKLIVIEDTESTPKAISALGKTLLESLEEITMKMKFKQELKQ